MAGRVKNLDKLTKELLINIASWEEVHGPFLFSVSKTFQIDRYSLCILNVTAMFIGREIHRESEQTRGDLY